MSIFERNKIQWSNKIQFRQRLSKIFIDNVLIPNANNIKNEQELRSLFSEYLSKKPVYTKIGLNLGNVMAVLEVMQLKDELNSVLIPFLQFFRELYEKKELIRTTETRYHL